MKKTIISILLTLTLIVSCVPFAFAKEAGKVTDAKSVESFLSAAQKMIEQSDMFQLTDNQNGGEDVNVNDKYQTGRIIVHPDGALPEAVQKKARDVLCFNDWYVLQFGSEKATKEAYKALTEVFDKDSVILDTVFQVQLPKAVEAKKLKTTDGYLSWGIPNMGLDKVQQKLNRKANKKQVKVAVLDSGISLFEAAFDNRIVDPFDMVLFNPAPYDFNGHGTHCASTIIDATPSNVKIMPVKTITGLGIGSIFNTFLGLLYAWMMGADIVNMSLAAQDEFEVKPYDFLLKEMVGDGMTIVVAAGNEAQNVKKSYPSSSQYVITVGATNKKNRVDKEYSNYGSKIDFVAPGRSVRGYATAYGLPCTANMTGTSMAAPHITAACALIKCVYPNYNQKQIYNVLKSCSIDIEAKGKDPYAGWGRIDMTRFANRI